MKKNIHQLFAFVLIIVGIAIFMMMFLPTLSFPDSDTSFTGFELIFGTEFANLGSFASGQISWSIWGILAYSLPLIAAVLTLYYKKIKVLTIALFVAATVLLVSLPTYTVTTITILNSVTEIEVDWVNAYGLVIAVVLASVGVMLSVYMFVNKK